jgi:hypothetical protein
MTMSPRLLRPRDTAFTPRSISGLALWLDASSSDSLYTTDAGPVVAVASPLDIATPALWLDGADSSAASMTLNGSLVETWKDKSNSGNDVTASGGLRPTLTSNALNSRSVLTFGGSQGLTGNLAASITTNAYSVFVVCKITGVITNGRLLSTAGAGNDFASGSVIPCVSNGGTLSAFAGTQGTNASGVTGFASYGVFAGVLSSNLVTNSAGGMSVASAAATLSTAVTRLGVGVAAQGGAGFNTCDIAEIILYPTALTTAQRASVESYLATKWGISGVHAPATASSDPVGYWADKSGNGRHAVMSVSGNRPTVGASSAAGKNAVRNNGTGSVALQVAAWPYTAGNTQFAVFNASAINQGIAQRGSLNDEPRMAIQTGANGVAAVRATRGGSVLAQTESEAGYALSQWAIGATLFNTSLGRAYRDGVYGADTTDSQTFSGDQELRLLSLPSNLYGINGGIAEFLYYDRQLNAVEVDRVARYLSRRWGITLAPQVSNADAQDWINRVYQNGGTVSAATAASVNTLCDSLESASLRDRFYRLNIFAGGNLNAALVPLFRTWRVYSGRNLLSVGDNLSASAWTKSGTTVTQSSSERPFAYGPYANAVTATAGSGVTPYVVAAGVVGFGTVTYSAYLKANGQNTVRILPIGTSGQTFPGGGTVAYANIDLSTGAISNVLAGTTATATNVGNGWWRLAYTVTNNGSGQTSLRFDIGNGNPYTAAGTESVLFWGLQNELGSTATEFDPYPLGNATDTNNAFSGVGVDYAETGATGGLKGNGSTKYLDTGLAGTTFSAGDRHCSAYWNANPTSAGSVAFIGNTDTTSNSAWFDISSRGSNPGSQSQITNAYGLTHTSANHHQLAQFNGANSAVSYSNGGDKQTRTAFPIGSPTAAASNWFVFGINPSLFGGIRSDARICTYSIGLSMSDANALAFYNAVHAFQTALGRQA